ncbi:MAG: hypothetical protein R3C61_01135 [Bacteroidia bacterium]
MSALMFSVFLMKETITWNMAIGGLPDHFGHSFVAEGVMRSIRIE